MKKVAIGLLCGVAWSGTAFAQSATTAGVPQADVYCMYEGKAFSVGSWTKMPDGTKRSCLYQQVDFPPGGKITIPTWQ